MSGCVFDQLQRSEENDIKRVEQKEAALQAEQDQSTALQQQEDHLAAELSERQLSLSELNDRVQAINARNGRTIADNDASRIEYHDLLGQLHETNEQLTQLTLVEQGTAYSIEERRKRIASLKARIKTQLDILFR